MGSPPLVSYVMSAYQPRADWLRKAVESVLSQRDANVELVVVDDGSPEPVENLLDGVDDPRLRVIRAEHGGVSHARNAGLHASRGDFVRFVDADDVLEPTSTARLVQIAQSGRDPVIVYGDTLICDEELRPVDVMRSRLEGSIAEECLLYRFDVRSISMLFPRSVVDAVGECDTTLRHCQDWDYVLRALEHAPVRREPHVVTFYRRHAGAQTTKLAETLHYERLVVDRYFERHPEQAGSKLERQARAQLLRVRAGVGRQLGTSQRERLATLRQAFALDRSGTAEHVLRGLGRLALRVAGATRRRLAILGTR